MKHVLALTVAASLLAGSAPSQTPPPPPVPPLPPLAMAPPAPRVPPMPEIPTVPPLPPIPFQQEPSNGIPRRSQREPGAWCRDNGVTPPPGSFTENMNMTVGG